MVKMTAPVKSVPLRPIMSPTRPAAMEVTERGEEIWWGGASLVLTKGADLQHGDHGAYLYCSRLIEIFFEVGAGNDTAHDTRSLLEL